MAIIQISKIQQRSGNIVDLPQLDEAEFGWATDVKRLYIGKTSPNENIEVLTSYSNISFSQINGSYGNLNIDGANLADGQSLVYASGSWTNRGGAVGGLIDLGDVSNVKIEGGALSYVLETDGTGNLAWAPKTSIVAFIENSQATVFSNSQTYATQTHSGNSVIIVGNTAGLTSGEAIQFTGTPFGNLSTGNTFYVRNVVSSTELTVSQNQNLSANFTLTSSNGNLGVNLLGVTVTTTENNFFVNGSQITITNVPGMTELNGSSYYVKIGTTANVFGLYSDALLTTPVNPAGYGAFPYTTATATNSLNNQITVGNVDAFTVNDPVIFLGSIGGIVEGSTYYVKTVDTGNIPGVWMTVSSSVGGNVVELLSDTGNVDVYVPGGRAVSIVGGAGGSGNGVAGGTNTMVQFNNTNTLDGDPDFTYTFTGTKVLTLNANANVGNLNATGVVTSTRLISNVATGSEPITVTSTTRVANLNVTSSNMADFAGNVTVATQSNITSLGTLTTLNVNARVNATGYTSNVATGTAPLTVTSTTRVANLNVAYSNVSDFEVVTTQTTGTFYPVFVNGNTTANYALGSNSNVAFNAATGNLSTTILNANGNITGGNVTTAGTGNIATLIVPTLANVTSTTAASSTTTGALQVAGGVGVAGNIYAGNNIVGANLSISNVGNIANLVVPTLANITSTSAASSTTTGALRVAGGAGIAGNLFVGGLINGNITSLTTGANTTAGSITGNWSLTAGSRLNATYADLAEYYNADQHYEPGTVLQFGGVNEVTIASNNTTSVAGVVSTDPAYAMNAKCPGDHPLPIALQGRVPTKVTGTIRKGDMMVSAGNGYATACSSPTMGTVIGKSLENFSGEGVIEIAVGRL